MNGIKPRRTEQIFFEDVVEGSEVPSLTKTPYNLGKMAMWAAVHADFCAGHFDYRTAKERFGLDRPFAYGLQLATYLSQLMTDWIGPNGMLKKIKSRTVHPILDKDRVTCKGKVVRKYAGEQEGRVDCEIWAEIQDGTVVARGSATVLLPYRRK